MDKKLAIALITLDFLIGNICGAFVVSNRAQRDAINHGVARYHPVTGQWEWTVPEVKKDKE